MKLTLGNFYVKDVVFGEKTAYQDGILTINKEEALAHIRKDKRVTKCDIVIAKPGDMIRLVPVKAIMEARCKVTEGCLFPGYGSYHNPLKHVGEGVTHCLKNMTVLTVGKYASFCSGIMDMGGPAAKHSMFSNFINACLVMETTDEVAEMEARETQMCDLSHHYASMAMAEYLGETVRNLTPEDCEEYNFDPILKQDESLRNLPKVLFVFQAESNGERDHWNQEYYGWPARHILPFMVSPTMILDGALCADQYHVAGMGQYNWNNVNNPTIKALAREHGKTINFVGVLICNNNADLECKNRGTMMTAEFCQTMGIDAAIVNFTGYGNTHVDFVDAIVALKKMGITTVGMCLEACGRDGRGQPYTVMNPEADMLVSTGNISEVVEFPPMEKVYGDIQCIVRDPSSGSWAEDDPVYGPSVRPDGSVALENNYVVSGCNSLGFSMKTMKEF